MLKASRFLLIVIILAGVLFACDESGDLSETSPQNKDKQILSSKDPLPKGDRILELDANSTQNEDYDRVMDLARQLGAESIRLSVYWDDIETAPGVFNPDPNWLAIADQYYSAEEFSISLVISVLDTTEIRVPQDLNMLSFSDPVFVNRFKDLLDYVKTQLTTVDLISLSIGNEIDGVLGSDPAAWKDYQTFFEETAAYAGNLWPGIPISTKVTYDGLTGPMAGVAQGIYENSSVIMTTYYPLKEDFSVKDPAVVIDDFQLLAELFPGKEIQITEIGYPTSKVNKSSQDKQAEFIKYMFQAWDNHAEQITVLSYSWLSDLPERSVQELENYYGLSNNAFGEFLRTLGLMTYPGAGEKKIGFDVFCTESASRGW